MHPMTILILFLMSSSSFSIGAGTTFTVLLAGQSNMAGRGGLNGAGVWDRFVPPESEPPIPDSVIRLSPDLTWERASEPLHRGLDFTVQEPKLGIGPGMPFATALLRHVDPLNTGTVTVALVPAAQGGTSIVQWQRGNNTAYINLLARAEAASRWFQMS
ncbi:Probable carbohydrate esterase [Striga hermonthica]|uniref:Probable carbohydrate esterase n=1 Tax=Striga hermonthica TaxID=68872 RepID=A0A9N7R8E6_STRHE|nr:Probable carbohydrate esterase [Striga hermonthica]